VWRPVHSQALPSPDHGAQMQKRLMGAHPHGVTVYTVRTASARERLSTHTELEDAVTALSREEIAHPLNPDPD
jgi:hypothetical protein